MNPRISPFASGEEANASGSAGAALGDSRNALNSQDLPRGAKIAGSEAPLYGRRGARLRQALAAFMLDIRLTSTDTPSIYPPFLVNRSWRAWSAPATFPSSRKNSTRRTTASISHSDRKRFRSPTFTATRFWRRPNSPLRYAAFGACFRREAGAAGIARGIQRVHQFDKIEMVWFTTPERSYADLETLVSHAERVLQKLGIHYTSHRD